MFTWRSCTLHKLSALRKATKSLVSGKSSSHSRHNVEAVRNNINKARLKGCSHEVLGLRKNMGQQRLT
jgi:hypothetical protein